MSNLSVVTNVLKTMETSSSLGMFARDTGGCLIARLGFSRSKDESKEISFAELSESAMFYFGAPLLARGSSKFYSGVMKVDNDKFTSSLSELKNIDAETLRRIKLGKFGRILTTFGLILPPVFAIAPMRNLMTYSETGKRQFTKVVGLEKYSKQKHRHDAKEKALGLMKGLAAAGSAIIAGGLGIMSLGKNPKTYKKLAPLIDMTTKHLDFTKNGDLTLAHYGALIYPVSIAGYFCGSRDKYEKMENVRRFSITVPLLFWGEKLIQNPIHKFFDKKFNTKVLENGGIKSYNEILKMPLEKRNRFLKSKNIAYALTFFINTMAIAGAVALLNRFETKRHYKKDNKNLTDSYSKVVR